MFDGAIILVCSKYFLGRPQPHLTKAKEAKIAKNDLTIDFMEVTSARDAFVWNVSVEVTFARGIYVGIKLSGISF